MTENQTHSDIKTPYVAKTIKSNLLLMFCIYIGCMMTDLRHYLMGDTTLSQLKTAAVNCFWPCAFLVCVCIGISLIRHKRKIR